MKYLTQFKLEGKFFQQSLVAILSKTKLSFKLAIFLNLNNLCKIPSKLKCEFFYCNNSIVII